MSSIIDSLRSDHSRMTKLLDALERQIGRFEEGGLIDFEIADGILHYCRSYPDRHHHPLEDLIYERLKRRNLEIASAMGDLAREHAKLAALTADFAARLDAVEQDVAMERHEFLGPAHSFLTGYRHHIMMEEKQFFPAAERSLTAEDWQAIQRALPPTADPLFERREDDRFGALYRDIVDWDHQLPLGA
jgi:hemerythrin-like domain-containing protein